MGEMEVQSMVSVGLIHSLKNIINRGDMLRVECCYVCQRIRLLCECGDDAVIVTTKLPFGTVILDSTTAVTHGSANVYDLEPDV